MKVMLETERLFLGKMTMEDFDSLYVVLADPDIMQHYPYVFDEKRVREWIERNMKRYEENGFGLWAVCMNRIYCIDKDNKHHLGIHCTKKAGGGSFSDE